MHQPLVNITIPVYNEEAALADNVTKLIGHLDGQNGYLKEIVIADNGSTDGTQSIAQELARRYSIVRTIHLPQPGRGRALKKAWSETQADILSYMDIDLSTDLAAFHPLIEPLLDGRCDLSTGSRRLVASEATRSFGREFLSRGYHWLVKALFNATFSDAQCGFKAITRKAADDLLPLIEEPGWLMDTELLLLAEKRGHRLLEIPVRWVENSDSRVRIPEAVISSLFGLLRLRRRLPSELYTGPNCDSGSRNTQMTLPRPLDSMERPKQ